MTLVALSSHRTTGSFHHARRAAPLVGVAVGVATSFLQGWLGGPWSALANAASPWLLVAFGVGLLQRSVSAAAALGALTCLGEVAGYYAASAARDFGISTAYVAFWVACALVAGPAFGACGRLARADAAPLNAPSLNAPSLGAAIGAAAPAATFLGEGIGSYGIRLGYHQDAVLFVAIGAVAGVVALALAPQRRVLTLAVIGAGTVAAVFGYLVGYGVVLGGLGGIG